MTRAQVVWTVVGSALALMATSSSAAWIVSRTIAESEARLRTEIQTGIRTVNERIDALDDSVNERIDALNDSVNERIDALNDNVNQRIDALNDNVNQRIHSVHQRLDTVLLDGGG
ncbi:MAG: hypothetical protein OXG35_02095 [Acidobacteria bacterium]|nr:hypothetical protein [Acidobacteriota bacterium]